MNALREKSVFIVFLTLSLVFHGFLLWQKETSHYDITNGEDIISVRLEDNTLHILAKKKPAIAPENKSRFSYLNPVQEISENLQPALQKEIKPVPEEVANVTHAGTTAPAIQETIASKEKIQNGIKSLFKANFYYPVIARRNNWQGKLEVSLTILPDGKLANIQVTKTSGFSILDNAAIDTLMTANILPEARTWLNGKPYDLVIPIEYRLVDS